MIDLTKKSLPDKIHISGRDFSIKTDYRIWIRFSIDFDMWRSKEIKELDVSYIFQACNIPNVQENDLFAILDFAFPKNMLPNVDGISGCKAIWFEYDGDYIYSAFLQQYGIDLLETDMHWWKFRALLNGIEEPTMLANIMKYRSYTGEKIKSETDMLRRLHDAWTPRIITEEDIEAEDAFNDFFN